MKRKITKWIMVIPFILGCFSLKAQTSISDNFDDNVLGPNWKTGQGYFLKEEGQVLKVKVGKQIWEEFYYELSTPLDLTTNPKVSFKVKADFYLHIAVALVDQNGKDNRGQYVPLQAKIFPSADFVDVSYDFTGKMTDMDPTKITSIRFIVDPAVEKSANMQIEDFKVGSTAALFPRMVTPFNQEVSVNSTQKNIRLTGITTGATVSATSSNTAIVPNPTVGAVSNGQATLSFAPAANQSGTVKINVKVSATGMSDLIVPFTIKVNPNLAPTIKEVAAIKTGPNVYKIDLSGITDGNPDKEQTITITAASSDETVIKSTNIKVDYTNPMTNALLTFTPENLATGSKIVNINVTLKDNGGVEAGGVDTKTLAIPVTVYANYYKPPTINTIPDNNFAYLDIPYTITLTGITDGNGGNKIASVTAVSSNISAVANPIVSYTPGANTATITYTAKTKEAANITVTVTNSGAPTNSNGTSSVTKVFSVKGIDPAYKGYVETFQKYGTEANPNPTPNILGGDYYSSGKGGEDRITWMTNLEAYDQKWFVEGQGAEQTFSINPTTQSATIAVNKPNAVPRTFAGTWYTPRKLFDLSENKYLSVKVSASPGTTIAFDIFDVNDNRYGKLVAQRVNATPQVLTFTFNELPSDADLDFTKIASVLINVSNMITYAGTVTISELKIGNMADNAPAAKPAEITMDPVASRTIFTSTPALNVNLSEIFVKKDGIKQSSTISFTATSSNTALIPNPTVSTVTNGMAVVSLKPVAGQKGTATITLSATATDGVASKSYTFDVNVIDRSNTGAAIITLNQSQTFQTIEGIGSSNHWIPEETVADMGASMVRFDVGGEYEPGLEGMENDNGDPNVLDISKFEYSEVMKSTIKKSIELGCKRVIGCVWTPPYWMKGVLAPRPSSTFPVENNILLPEYYDEFAEYITGLCLAFKNEFGIDLYSISLQNEAEFGNSANYTATCQYTKETMVEVVKITYKKMQQYGVKTTIHGFDQLPQQGNVLNWFQYANNDLEAKNMIHALSFHAYGANAIDPAQIESATLQSYWAEVQRVEPKKQLWMTETSGWPVSAAGGITAISSIFTNLANNVGVWTFLGVDKSQGMIYYVHKNFAKFIRPGAVRIGASSNDNSVAGIAFKHTADQTYTVVLVNTTQNAKQVNLSGTVGLPPKMYAYLTSANINCVISDTVTNSNNYSVFMPAGSIITLYSKMVEGPLTSVEEENAAAAKNEMILFPNPASNKISIMTTSENSEATIMDIYGRIIVKRKVSGIAFDMDLTGFEKGIYIINVKGAHTYSKKFIVE